MRLDIEKMERKDYRIDIINLKNGTYEYDFNIKDEFFEFFDNSIVDKANLGAKIDLEKSERLIRVRFDIKGTINLICDRSLKPFDHPLVIKNIHLFKYSNHGEEDTEDISYISPDKESIDLGQLIYEYICIAVPMKKIHPDHRKDHEDDDFFYRTDVEDSKDSNEEIDPRWEALKKLNK